MLLTYGDVWLQLSIQTLWLYPFVSPDTLTAGQCPAGPVTQFDSADAKDLTESLSSAAGWGILIKKEREKGTHCKETDLISYKCVTKLYG